jgi:hypothetical protein
MTFPMGDEDSALIFNVTPPVEPVFKHPAEYSPRPDTSGALQLDDAHVQTGPGVACVKTDRRSERHRYD